jgi:hypothetical protein
VLQRQILQKLLGGYTGPSAKDTLEMMFTQVHTGREVSQRRLLAEVFGGVLQGLFNTKIIPALLLAD